MEELIEGVWEYAKNNPDGFTLNIKTMRPVKFGICVAFLETQNSFGRESLRKVVKHALENEGVIGGWMNDGDGNFYFDSVRIFKNSELEQALKMAVQNQQIAIFDLTNLREIRL